MGSRLRGPCGYGVTGAQYPEPQDSGPKCRAGRPSHAFVTAGGILCFGLVPIHVMGPRAMA